MSFNGLLIQVVLFSCLALLLRLRVIAPGFAIAAAFNLGVLGLLFGFIPATCGWFSGGIWGITLLLPLLFSAHLRQLMLREEYIAADRLVRRLPGLAWTGGYWQMPSLVQALALAQQNKPVQALDLLGRDRWARGSLGQNATVVYYRISAQWPECLAWIQLNFSEAALMATPSALGLIYVRALGEMGKTEEMVRVFGQLRSQNRLDRASYGLLRMVVLAFCGRQWLVMQLLDEDSPVGLPLAGSKAGSKAGATKAYWLAIAGLSQGDRQGRQRARAALQQQAVTADGLMQAVIEYRLKHALPSPNLSEPSWQILAQVEAEIQSELRAGPRPFAKQRGRSRLTWALIGLNSFVFLSEVGAGLLGQGLNLWGWFSGDFQWVRFANLGETYGNALFLAGALVPSQVLAGEWWRIGSAMFLHANLLHLASNMLALFYYGSYVESRLGWLRFGLIYGLSGLGSMLGMMGVALLQGEPNLYGVGASGAVMGILGTMLALVMRRWWIARSGGRSGGHSMVPSAAGTPDGQTLRLLITLVVLQTLTDFLIPQISVSAHLSGLAIGLVLGSLVGEQA